MVIDWPSLILGATPLTFGLALRFLLDMHLWPCLIKNLSWAPVRGIFRTNSANLRGEWNVYWESKSEKFSSDIQRKKTAKIYQLDGYYYTTYAAGGQRYCMTGKIEGLYLTGVWHNLRDANGYRGSFQLRIVSQRELRGRWLGFSATSMDINTGSYVWIKNP